MTAAHALDAMTVDQYLADERVARQKHEYVDGAVYVMAGGTNTHNAVATAFLISVGSRLRGKHCQTLNSDTKVRLRYPSHTRFYYPDAMIVCEPNPAGDVFQDRPVVLAEVLSDSTRRTDLFEKRDAYLTIPTLAVYLIVDTHSPRVVTHERTNDGFVARVYEGLCAVVPLPAVGIDLPLAELYERVDFAAAIAEAQATEDL